LALNSTGSQTSARTQNSVKKTKTPMLLVGSRAIDLRFGELLPGQQRRAQLLPANENALLMLGL
jgi:hypothetical protein